MRTALSTLLTFLILTSTAYAGEVRLSVAASMTDAVKELITTYKKTDRDVTLLPNFASSGALAKQIAQGAPTDIFISANPKWMTYLVSEGIIPDSQVRPFAHNSLVMVGVRKSAIKKFEDITKLELIALGSPRSTPAGQYAAQALKTAGLYDKVAKRLVMAQDVRKALAYADRGEVDAAFVYKTDALLAKDAGILFEIPQVLHDEVLYPLGLTTSGVKNPEAKAFLEFLQTDEAIQALKKFGFIIPQ